MLELWQSDGAFRRIDGHLRGAGFFEGGADGLCADVFLGYGLSRVLRRTAWPDPAEPCRLPLAACRIRHAVEPEPASGSFSSGEWEPTWAEDDHAVAVEEVKAAIAHGDVYQVNLVQHLSAPFSGDPRGVAAALAPLRPLCPRPLVGDGWAIVSASPELFLARRGDRIWTMPIKGTRPRGESDDLRESEKDAAEHLMIVDLERNDLSRVCLPGTVRWPELMVEREAAGVVHLVSTVEGRLEPDTGLPELLEAVFPGGSITGAPKISAIDHVAALEPVGRGASMGALGTVWPNGDLELALTIRTFGIADDRIHLWVGGGIVWDSEPHAEIEETRVKARPLLAAIGARLRPGSRVTLLAVAVAGRGLVDPREPILHADDTALLRGQAAFETLRVYGGRPFRIGEHLDRLVSSAGRIGLPPVGREELEELAETALAAAGAADCVLRLYWTGGREGSGHPTALAMISPLPSGYDELRARGIRLISLQLGLDPEQRATSPWLLGGVKSTSYAVNMAAEAEARRLGADDALFLASDATVLEGPVTNVWWRAGRTLRTPSLDLGILAGVTRSQILESAAALGYEIEEGRFPLETLASADEAFTSSSVREIMPVVALDDRPIGSGRPGPAAAALQDALREAAQGTGKPGR